VLLGPVVALLATGPAGNWPGGWLVALTVVMSAGFAAMPESGLGTAVLCVVIGWWGVDVESVPVEAIVAGTSLVAAHVCAVLLSYGPMQLPVDRRVAVRWLRRGALLALSGPMAWLLALAVDGHPAPPGIWVAALVATVVGSAVAAAAFPERVTP
jgi:hypothetical protein